MGLGTATSPLELSSSIEISSDGGLPSDDDEPEIVSSSLGPSTQGAAAPAAGAAATQEGLASGVFSCPICLVDDVSLEDCFRISCCGHQTCRECAMQCVRANIQAGRPQTCPSCLSAPCPRCPASVAQRRHEQQQQNPGRAGGSGGGSAGASGSGNGVSGSSGGRPRDKALERCLMGQHDLLLLLPQEAPAAAPRAPARAPRIQPPARGASAPPPPPLETRSSSARKRKHGKAAARHGQNGKRVDAGAAAQSEEAGGEDAHRDRKGRRRKQGRKGPRRAGGGQAHDDTDEEAPDATASAPAAAAAATAAAAPVTFDAYLRSEAVLAVQDVRYVVCHKCGEGLELAPDAGLCVHCPACHYKACRVCEGDWHDETTCQKYQAWRKKDAGADAAFRRLHARHGSKACPQCGNACSKISGCNHVVCAKCKTNYCYGCCAKVCVCKRKQ